MTQRFSRELGIRLAVFILRASGNRCLSESLSGHLKDTSRQGGASKVPAMSLSGQCIGLGHYWSHETGRVVDGRLVYDPRVAVD